MKLGLTSLLHILALAAPIATLASTAVFALNPGEPIRVVWQEGDIAGMTGISSPDGNKQIGFVEYHQRRRGDLLDTVRISRFADGSSDEDRAQARIGKTLEAINGRSIIRDTRGQTIVDITIDVPNGRITGFSGIGKDRKNYDQHEDLPPGTYWGALIFIVVKNFDENAIDGRLVFRTVAPTPQPRTIDLELVREGPTSVSRVGGELDVIRFAMRPTMHWLLDPIIQRIAPETEFFVQAGSPPALARYEGPRNYAGQEVRLE
jgi:hypothetical protein